MSASDFLRLQIKVGLYLKTPELHSQAIIPWQEVFSGGYQGVKFCSGQGVPTSTELHSQMLSSVLHELIQIKNNPFVSVFVFLTVQVSKTMNFPKLVQLQVKDNALQHQHGCEWLSRGLP